MQSGWFPHAVAGTAWRHARLHGPVALILLCAGVIGLLTVPGSERVAAQSVCASQSTDPDSPLIRDCETLLGLKDTLRGSATLNWAGNLALSSWDGVGLDSGTTSGVVRLFLGSKGLTGTIPAALGDLEDLRILTLESNTLTGTIPSELGNLESLTALWLRDNQLTGEIPTSLGQLTNLEFLRLGENQLSGSIPKELGQLTNLVELMLSDNQLSGPIPRQLGNLASLWQLHLHQNRLTGSIPRELGALAALGELHLAENRLTGSIPTGLADPGDLPNLERLYLWSNRLTGRIPAALGNLTNLQELVLNVNALTGSIPPELGSLTNLQKLYLRHNNLSGSIPAELGDLGSLKWLSLRHNELSGAIPSELGALINLESLWLSANDLSGTIHSQVNDLARLHRLTYADMTCNSNTFTGNVPADLAAVSVDEPAVCIPSAPQNVQVQRGDGQLTVTWAAPADDGTPNDNADSPITAYDLWWWSTSTTSTLTWTLMENAWTTGGGDLTYTITGLDNGTRYAVQVRAVNNSSVENGKGGWSAPVTGTPGDSPPPPPSSPSPPPKPSNGGGGSSGGGSRAPSPPPAPTRSPIIGSTSAATAKELAGDLLVLQRHDQPGVEVEVGIGWISKDGQRIITIGFVRDGDLGQTYAVVRREGDGQVVRRWIAPDSPLRYAVPWPIVNTQHTFPVGVILAIPLDDQYPPPNMLMRRFDGGDDRILAYDAGLGQWRHVPDLATFQARGYYWCNVTAADAGFFDRITLGPPYPATTVPARPDYPVCQT